MALPRNADCLPSLINRTVHQWNVEAIRLRSKVQISGYSPWDDAYDIVTLECTIHGSKSVRHETFALGGTQDIAFF